MSVNSHFGSFNTGVGAVGSTIAINDLPFTPRAILFWWSGRTEAVDTAGRANSYQGFGVAVSPTDRRNVTTASEDAVGTSNTARAHSDSSCISTVSVAGVRDGALDLQSIDLDGFTLVVDDQLPNNLRIHYLALGGDSLEAAASGQFQEPGATGNQDITVGWQPDCIILFSTNITSAPTSASTVDVIYLGAAVSSAQQATTARSSDDAVATTVTASYANTNECIGILSGGGSVVARASFVSFLSDGFRLNWSERNSTRYIHYLALRGGNYAIGKLQTQTNTVTPIVIDTLSFKPSSALFVSHNMAESAPDTSQDDARLSIGAFSAGATRGAQAILDRDNLSDSEVTTAIEFDAIYANIATDSTIQGLMDIQDINDDGFTTIMDDADTSQAFVWWLAFGPAAIPTPPTPTVEPACVPQYTPARFTLTNTWQLIKPTGTTNYALNPSAETTGNFAAIGAATVTRSTTFQKYGLHSYRVQTTGSGQGLSLTLSALTNSVHYVTLRARGPIPDNLRVSLGPSSKKLVLVEKIDDHWDLYANAFDSTEANGATTLRITQYGGGVFDFNIDGVQVEPNGDWTTFCDGTQEGCAWNGTEHASTSTRSALSTAGGIPQDLYQEYRFFVQRVVGSGATTQTLNIDSYALLPGGELNSLKVESRQFTLVGKFITDTEMELHDYRQDLLKTLRMAGPGQPLRLRFNGARVQKEISVFYQGGLEGDLAAFYRNFEAEGDDTWVEMQKFIEKASIQWLAPDPYWYEVGESAADLDTNDSATFRVVAGRLRETGQWSNLGPPSAISIGQFSPTSIFAITEDTTYIYFGGDFTNFDGIANADYIVRYNKQTGVYSALGTGMDNIVYSLATGPDGSIYAGGSFASAGGVANTTGISRWDGSAWNSLSVNTVTAVFVIAFGLDGTLYAGGSFASQGGVANTSRIAKYSGGSWSSLATGANGDVRGIAVDLVGLIYAVGDFTNIGTRAAYWNGSTWTAMGSGLNSTGWGVAVAPSGLIYVVGNFTTAGGNSINYIASWNGTAWVALGDGLNAQAFAISIGIDGKVYAGGNFTTADGIAIADRIARWNGYAWAHLDLDLPGIPSVYAILASKYIDPVIKQKYDLYLGFTTTGTGSFAGLVTVENGGNIEVFPKIVFERSTTGLPATIQTLRNETTGKELLFNYSLLAGERLKVDLTPTQKSVISNFFGDRFDAVLANSDFGTWALNQGDNDVTNFINTANALYGDITTSYLLWRDKYDSWD